MGIDIASIVGSARQAFVAAGLGPKDLLAAADNSRDHGSPLGLTADKLRERIEWLEDEHEVKIALDKDKADILLTVSSIEMMKYPDSVVAMAKILNHADVKLDLKHQGLRSQNATFHGVRAAQLPFAGVPSGESECYRDHQPASNDIDHFPSHLQPLA
jgi:hypothetical protein